MQEKRDLNCRIRKIIIYSLILLLPWYLIFVIGYSIKDSQVVISDSIKVDYNIDTLPSIVDHSKFEVLKQKFTSPKQVTEACVSCHNKRHKEVMASSHWSWNRESVRPNGDTVKIGKENVINNFCIATTSNRWKCTSCHIGYGWKDNKFDFTDYKNVDCLVCHDTTGAYEKQPLGSGFPVEEKRAFSNKTYFPPNYSYIAKNVGKPRIENCGKCHFFGGGGDNVKHGDLSSDLYHADKKMDVHMAKDGANLSCIDCHQTERHNITGKLYSVSNNNKNRATCEECHKGDVHKNNTLNRHTNKIACQTCHIPTYAKCKPTKMVWDWSTAGKLDKRGKQFKEYDSLHNVTYKSAKGTFKWETNVTPEYTWFNGTADQYIPGDVIEDTTNAVILNKLFGSYNDKNSKIIPVKIHRGKQIFDPVNKMLIVPHIYGHDSTAYHHGLDWNTSAEAGMKEAGLPYSGKYTFIKTEMYWPLNHMISPVGQSLKCIDCHSKTSRLKDLNGFYMPGRDHSIIIDLLGIVMIIGALGGILTHSIIRIFKSKHII